MVSFVERGQALGVVQVRDVPPAREGMVKEQGRGGVPPSLQPHLTTQLALSPLVQQPETLGVC